MPQSHLRVFEAYTVPTESLPGWCLQYRVWTHGYAGQPIPDKVLRQDLDSAVQYHGICHRYWGQTGGLGRRYGAPGAPLPPSPGEDNLFAEEDRERQENLAYASRYGDDLDG